jgi:SulP family sulfate permease
MGELPDSLPVFLLPDVPLNLETLRIILPYSLTLAVVGLLESMMTASIVDDLTDTQQQEPRMRGPGRGQHRHRLHRRHGRLRHDRPVGDQREIRRPRAAVHAGWPACCCSCWWCSLGDWVAQIPMAALVAVMIMVSIGTFNWARSATCASTRPVPASSCWPRWW